MGSATARLPALPWRGKSAAVTEFDQLPRSGETMYGFALGVYPTDQPTLPDSGE